MESEPERTRPTDTHTHTHTHVYMYTNGGVHTDTHTKILTQTKILWSNSTNTELIFKVINTCMYVYIHVCLWTYKCSEYKWWQQPRAFRSLNGSNDCILGPPCSKPPPYDQPSVCKCLPYPSILTNGMVKLRTLAESEKWVTSWCSCLEDG